MSNDAGHTARTDRHPAFSPVSRSSREGQSAGLASVAIRSMNTLILSSKTRSQKIEIKMHRSSLDEYPLIKAASTASESISKIKSAPKRRSLNVCRAKIGATISTGTICVFLLIQNRFRNNFRKLQRLSQPSITRSGRFSLLRGSGVKPSVKITTSAGFSLLMSIGLGGPASTRRNKAILEREANVLPFRYGSKEGSPYLAPELTCTEHELAFQLSSSSRIEQSRF